MTQEVAQILKTKGYMLTCRGTISVKGKGDMVTYFLDAMAPKEWRCDFYPNRTIFGRNIY